MQAANSSLQQRLAEAAMGTPGAREPSGSLDLQAQLESSEARCRELEQASLQAHQRVRHTLYHALRLAKRSTTPQNQAIPIAGL